MSSKKNKVVEIPAVEGQKSTERLVKVVVRKGLRSKIDRRRGRYKVKTKEEKEADRKSKEKKAKRDAKKALKESPEYKLLLKQLQELQKKIVENETKEKNLSSSGRYYGGTRGVGTAFGSQKSGTSKEDIEKLLKEQQEKLQKQFDEFKNSFTSEFLKQKKKDEERTQKQFREQGGDAITSPDYYDDDDDDDDAPTTETRRTIRGGILREYSNADVQRNEQRNPNAQQRRTPQPQPKQELESKARRILSQPAPQPEQELEEIPQPRQEIPQPTPSFEDEPDVIDEPDKPLVIPEPDEVDNDEFLSGIQPEEIERKKKPNITRPTLTRQSHQQEQKLHITSTRQEPILYKSSEKDVEQIKSDLEEQTISELEKQRISQLERQRIDEVLKEIEPEVKPKKDIQQKLSQQSLEENLRKTKEIDEMIKQQAKDRKFENREIEDLPSRKQKGQLLTPTLTRPTLTRQSPQQEQKLHITSTRELPDVSDLFKTKRKVDRPIEPINEREQLRSGRTLQQTKLLSKDQEKAVDLTEDERKDITERNIKSKEVASNIFSNVLKKQKDEKQQEDKAATKLQSAIRARQARSSFRTQQEGFNELQALVRGQEGRKAFEGQKKSIEKGIKIKEGKEKAKQKREEEEEFKLALQTEEEQKLEKVNVEYQKSIFEKKIQNTKRKEALEVLQTEKLITFFTRSTQNLLKNKNFKKLADGGIIEKELERLNIPQFQKSKIKTFMTSNNEYYKLEKKSEKLKKKLDKL
jgi:hypothetical protein